MNLTKQQIVEMLDEYLEAEFTFIRTDELAALLVPLEDRHNHFILAWVKSLASTQVELAHQFIKNVIRVLDVMDRQTIEEVAVYTLDVYDTSGLHPAMEVIRNVDQYVELSRVRQVGSVYSEVHGVLSTFVHGLSGRELKIEQGEYAYTDSETIYLPRVVSLFDTKEENFNLYKAMVTMLWAQTRYGTFRGQPLQNLNRYEKPQQAIALYHAMETIRLEACIERELPGLFRRMLEMKKAVGMVYPEHWQEAFTELSAKSSSASDSMQWMEKLYGEALDLKTCYQGVFRLHEVESVMSARIEREKALLRVKLAELIDEVTPAGDGEYDPSLFKEPDPDEVWQGTYHEEGAELYDEWDVRRDHYRKS